MTVPYDLLFVGTVPPHPGGSGVANGLILEGLRDRGHRIRVLAPGVAGASEWRADGIDVLRYPVPTHHNTTDHPASPEYVLQERSGLRTLTPRLVGERRPQVLAVGRETLAGDVYPVARACGLPLFQIVHGATIWGLLEDRYPIDVADGIWAGLRGADRVVTPGEHMARLLGEHRVECHVVRNPVDLGAFRPGPADPDLRRGYGLPDDAVVLLHASNFKGLKRVEDLLAAVETVADDLPEVRVLIVGDGPAAPTIRERVNDSPCPDRFVFTGWLANRELPDLMRASDLVVMTSERENQAMVYLEAQASGRVLVSSDIAAAREVVTHGKTGLLFPLGDTDRLAGQIRTLARDPEMRREIGRRSRERVKAHGIDEVARSYEAELGRVVEPRPS